MSMIYSHNPFTTSAPIAEIVWRMVHPDESPEFDVDRRLSGDAASPEENEWHRLHDQNPIFFLEVFYSDYTSAHTAYEDASNDSSQSHQLPQLASVMEQSQKRWQDAVELNRELIFEADYLRQNANKSDTGLKLTEPSLSSGSDPRFLLYSVYDWALDYHGLDIREWARPSAIMPRRERAYTNRLLTIMDEAIVEFCVRNDPERMNKESFLLWLNQNHPEVTGNTSQTMYTIIKPDNHRGN